MLERSDLGPALDVPSHLLTPEKILLYGLVHALVPRRVLLIGPAEGSAPALICAALRDLGDAGRAGFLACIDPEPRTPAAAEAWMAWTAWMGSRIRVLAGTPEETLPAAERAAGGPFALAWLDGEHSRPGVARNLASVSAHLEDEAHLLVHDCHYPPVGEGIDDALRDDPELVDAGVVSTASHRLDEVDDLGRPVVWGGLRLLRFRRARSGARGAGPETTGE